VNTTRLALLLMVHDKPEQLARLVDAMQHEGIRFYVHVDLKSDMAPFEVQLAGRDNVRFLRQRVRANWMAFSLVEATLRLLAEARAEGFDYCVLLSGADYPIKSAAQLLDFYGRAQGEYIAFWRLQDRPSWLPKVRYHYLMDRIPIRDWIAGKEPSYLRRFFWGRFYRYRQYMPVRSFPAGFEPYGGPDWWSLSRGCVDFVLDFVARNPSFVKFYRTASSPGEMFFQTMILNSDWASRVENCEEYWRWSGELGEEEREAERSMIPDERFNYRYVDWSGERDGLRETPAILDERDWEQLLRSPSHFARKFHPERSAALLERIDRDILGLPAARGND